MAKALKQHIKEMKAMAEMLMSHTFPVVDFERERQILVFKQRTIVVDGYELIISVNKSNYNTYHSLFIQIQSVYSPFLPFNLICNLAKAFLGDINVSYVDFFRDGKKLYCWNIRTTPNGEILPPAKDTELSFYEGFTYYALKK